MAKKPSEIPEREEPTIIPPEEPTTPLGPTKEPEVKPEIEPTVPFNPPREIPQPPERSHLKLNWL